MKVVHITLLIFTQILLASFIFYSVSAATLQQQHQQQVALVASKNQQSQQPKLSPKSVSSQAPAPAPVVAPVPTPSPVAAPAPAAALVVPAAQPKVSRPAVSNYPTSNLTQADAVTLGIKGGLGPLHLLAETLCNPQPESLEEPTSPLYTQRSNVRKSLFDFMSLKFTDLEKLSSRLNVQHTSPAISGKSQDSSVAESQKKQEQKAKPLDSSNGVSSRGWPVVGKCTAHDFRLMSEAAWCDCADEEMSPNCGPQPASQFPNSDGQPAKITSNIPRVLSAPPSSSSASGSSAISAEKSKGDGLSSYAAPAGAEQNLTDTRECRKNSLRLAKSLFGHLAESQQEKSESWPKLYAQIAEDECARRRLIDIVSALSTFRSESGSIRRDNVEFAFAMDDLRAKVLENEVNTPLQFDRQFIEVEQFLQQSVKLVLANIDPERARLASMRYRSLFPGPASTDDQCVELHQRLLAKNYPTDCNPNQFGQLPDVLRMTAKSLELWSLEIDLAKYNAAKRYAASGSKLEAPAPLKGKQEIEECIVSLVDSERM